MYDIDEIMKMLDWNNSVEIQQKGVELAKDIKTINAFILPLHEGCNKNVWENCAKIIAQKPNKLLEPYLYSLLEWLQDANWPGFDIIFNKIKTMPVELVSEVYSYTIKKAVKLEDEMWLVWLSKLIKNEKLKYSLKIEVLEMLKMLTETE